MDSSQDNQTLMVYSLTINNVNPDLQNEEITSVELGYGFVSNNFRDKRKPLLYNMG